METLVITSEEAKDITIEILRYQQVRTKALLVDLLHRIQVTNTLPSQQDLFSVLVTIKHDYDMASALLDVVSKHTKKH